VPLLHRSAPRAEFGKPTPGRIFLERLAESAARSFHHAVVGRLPIEPPAESPEPLLEGRPYRLVELVGRGGMGSVYVVEHRLLQKRFALKVPHRFYARPAFADRMRVEAQAIARLSHPNVVEVVDFWTVRDHPCIVLELLTGGTLAQELVERRRLPVPEAVELAVQALAALAAAHALGIVHRDIKPENLYLHREREGERVLKVLDFGLARILPEAVATAPAPLSVPTQTGTRLGSPAFMSPEALRGEHVGPAADLYSLGLVLYTMLAGHGPFDRGPTLEPQSHHVPGLPRALDRAVLRALEAAPEQRFADASEFREALRSIPTSNPDAHAGG
jgi:serine/threonine-protein kinase